MGCVVSQSENRKGICSRRLLKRRHRRQCYDDDHEKNRRPELGLRDRCNTIVVPQLVRTPRGYYDGRRTTPPSSYEESSEEQHSTFGPWKGHRFVGHRQPSSPAVVSDSWSFAVGSPAASLGSPVMFSEVWSKQGKRNPPPASVAAIDEATEMELEVEGGELGSPFVDPPGWSSSPERGKGNEEVVEVFRRRRKSGSVGEPMFMEAFVFE